MNHFYQNIQGWFHFAASYTEAVQRAPNHGARFVEIGTWKGRSLAFLGVEIVNSGKSIELHCVDTWEGSQEAVHRNDPALPMLFETFKSNIQPLTDAMSLHVHRGMSTVIAAGFPDAYFDFVWLDASHTFEDVLADIQAWKPKLRPGGVLGGDDYQWPGVYRAVNDLLPGHRTAGDYPAWTFTLEKP